MLEPQNKIDAFITVRSKSIRLPGKCFLPFGEYNVLEHVINRALSYNLNPIVCTTVNKEDNKIIDIAKSMKVRFFRGSIKNKLKRWRDCCVKFNIDYFHSVDADDPFFCGEEVHRSIKLFLQGYDMIEPTRSSSNGGATVGYSLSYDIINKACEGLDDESDTEMMWYFIKKIPNLKSKILPEAEKYIIKDRLTLDYPEDYEMLDKLRSLVGNFAVREKIYQTLKNNRDIVNINMFRNSEWLNNQKEKGNK